MLDGAGYVAALADNLVEGVSDFDFMDDLRQGGGKELEGKFRAAHSSSALGVNNFAPFKRSPSELWLLGKHGFASPSFERKCSAGVRGTPPNLDVVVEGDHAIIGIESKCTEFLQPHVADFSPAHDQRIQDSRRDGTWFAEMMRLKGSPRSYVLLDASQLIKHAFGLACTFPQRPTTLLYLFWEPTNAREFSIFAQHRQEIAEFAGRVMGANPAFQAMSYPELWSSWENIRSGWMPRHIASLRARYAVTI